MRSFLMLNVGIAALQIREIRQRFPTGMAAASAQAPQVFKGTRYAKHNPLSQIALVRSLLRPANYNGGSLH